MPLGFQVLVAMTLASAAMSLIVVMIGGRSISYTAMNASEARKNLTEFTLGWAGVWWFCVLPITIAAPLLLTVPLLMPFAYDMEPVVRITLLIHLLGIPGLTGVASLLAGSYQEVEP